MAAVSLSALLKKYDLQPRKSLAQNFLADPFHLGKIIEAAELTSEDTVLEIGPGPGTLTRRLVEAAGRVIVVELDANMIELLKNELGHFPNLTILEADILQLQIGSLFDSVEEVDTPSTTDPKSKIPPCRGLAQNPKSKIGYKVVANLPYYITSAVLRQLLEATPRPARVVVTIQKEVAQRITAQPGDMSLLAVSVQFYGRPKLVHQIPAGAFYPPPKVDSAVLRIDTYPAPPVPVADVDYFFRVVKAGFSQKRKQLKNTLASSLQRPMTEVIAAMERAGVEPTRRAQTLSLEAWGRLAKELAE